MVPITLIQKPLNFRVIYHRVSLLADDLMEEKERPSFEEALKQLEYIVEQLESPEITLEDSVKLYEKGMELSKQCNEVLHQAELKIEQVNSRQDQD